MTAALVLMLLSAQEPLWQPGAAEAELFKVRFEAGEKLFQAGDYGAAIWSFQAAEAMRVTPEVAYDLAKCHEKLGDVAFMTLWYRQYLKRAPQASDALTVAERVGTVLAAAEAEGRGLLEVDARGATDITVQGRTFPEGPAAIFLPPGEYSLEAKFPSGPKRMVVQVRTGKTTTTAFEPLPPPLMDAVEGLPDSVLAQGPKGPGPKPLRVGSYVAFGAGVAALAAGTVLGVLSRVDGERLYADKTLTVSQADVLAEQANTQGAVANVLWGVGGAAAGAGILMFVFSMPEPGMQTGGGSP